MGRNTLNLNSIRAFEAVARHLSFTRAAEELNVTQAAVSHQIKALEERMGVMLFLRHNKGLQLTKEGRLMFHPLTRAFDLLEDATNLLLNSEVKVLKISMPCSFASMWLVPRLNSFYEQYPNIDIRVMVKNTTEDLLKVGDVDIDIRHGDGKWHNVQAQKFLNEIIFPVCSPALLNSAKPLQKPDDLQHYTLIHDNKIIGWKEWLDNAGIKGVDYTRGPGFSHYHLVLQSAIQGDGIALGRSPLVADAIHNGRLIRPLDISLPTGLGYYMVTTNTAEENSEILVFADWLIQEAQQFETAAAGVAERS
jgi:LysR family glycine cleavage system transcriptional activator